MLGGCAHTIPYDYPRTISSALTRPEETRMGRKIQAQVVKHLGASGFYLLPTGTEAFLARVLAIDRAEKTLDLQYYIFHDDLTGKFILDRLMAAAERGVRVRLLLDDWRQTAARDWWLIMMEIHPNIEVRVYNPFGGLRSNPLSRPLQAIFGPRRLRSRMHNKAFIADNSVAIVGGRNIADEYFGVGSDINFRDVDLVALGPIARQVSVDFDDYWNCVLSVPLSALVSNRPSAEDMEKARRELAATREALKKSSYWLRMQQSDLMKKVEGGKVPFIWAPAAVLYDDPLKAINPDEPGSEKMAHQLRAFIEGARHEAIMVSPYVIPGKAGMQWFRDLRCCGVTVKILTNSFATTDSPLSQIAYWRYRKDLLRLGVDLYELKPTQGLGREEEFGGYGGSGGLGGSAGSSRPALHAKILVLDRQAVFIGSFNLDPRSEKFDTQDGIIVRSPELAQEAVGWFNKDISPAHSYHVIFRGDNDLGWVTEENGKEVMYRHEPGIKLFKRIPARIFYLIIPEAQI